MNTQSCDMVRQPNVDAVLDGPPGSFCFDVSEKGQRRLWFVQPDGNTGVINIRPVVAGEDSHPFWQWDGNEDKPTLAPSVHQPGIWHGWFRVGRMVSC
jgi:Family of unknown function (DUF6527)